MKILLVKPPEPEKHEALDFRFSEHLGIGYLASYLRSREIPAEIIDARISNLSKEILEDIILKNEFDILGISIPYQWSIPDAIKLINNLRNKGLKKKVIVGGHPSTFFYKELLDAKYQIDFVCVGEGEYTLYELIVALNENKSLKGIMGLAYRENNEVIFNGYRNLIDLDKLPYPARDTLPEKLNAFPNGAIDISGSRGCSWGRCSFCDIQTFYNLCEGEKWRKRSIRNILDEIEYIIKIYKYNKFNFADDDFFGYKEKKEERVNEFCIEIERRKIDMKFRITCKVDDIQEDLLIKLKKAGLERVFIGSESGIQRALNTYRKGIRVKDNFNAVTKLKSLGIQCDCGSIFIDPYSTMKEIKENFEFWLSLDQMSLDLYSELLVFNGTYLQKTLLSEDRIIEQDFDYSYSHSMDQQVVLFHKLISKLIKEYFRPRYGKLSKLAKRLRMQQDSLNMGADELCNIIDKLSEYQKYWFKDLFNKVFYQIILDIDNINESNIDEKIETYLGKDLLIFKNTYSKIVQRLNSISANNIIN